jgi:TPR repeat protein
MHDPSRVLSIVAVVGVLILVVLGPAVLAQDTPTTQELADLRARAEAGDASAQFNLGVAAYENGEGVPGGGAEAVRWFRLAAEQGHASAQFNLGLMYANGRGVPQNDVEAGRRYRLAAEQGNASAQLNLGVLYATGEGVPQDAVEAIQWYRLAAEQGNPMAQFNLGYQYDTGEGVPQDATEALAWYRLARNKVASERRTTLGSCMPTVGAFRRMTWRLTCGSTSPLHDLPASSASGPWPCARLSPHG